MTTKSAKVLITLLITINFAQSQFKFDKNLLNLRKGRPKRALRRKFGNNNNRRRKQKLAIRKQLRAPGMILDPNPNRFKQEIERIKQKAQNPGGNLQILNQNQVADQGIQKLIKIEPEAIEEKVEELVLPQEPIRFPSPLPRPLPDPEPKKEIITFNDFIQNQIYWDEEEDLDFSQSPPGYALLTDKAVYRPGETVHAQVYFYDKYDKSPRKVNPDLSNANPRLIMNDGNDQEVLNLKDFRAGDYVITFDLELSENQAGGFFTLQFSNGYLSLVQRVSIFIINFQQRREILVLKTNKDIVSGGDKVVGEAELKVLGKSVQTSELAGLAISGSVITASGRKISDLGGKTNKDGKFLFSVDFPEDLGGDETFSIILNLVFEGAVVRASKELRKVSLNEIVVHFVAKTHKWVEGFENVVFYEAFVNDEEKAEYVVNHAILFSKSDTKGNQQEEMLDSNVNSHENGKGKLKFRLEEQNSYYLRIKQGGAERDYFIVKGADLSQSSFANVKLLSNKSVFEQSQKMIFNIKKRNKIKATSVRVVVQDKTKILLEKEIDFIGDTAVFRANVRNLNFKNGGVATVQVFRPKSYNTADQEMLIYVHPQKRLNFGVDLDQKVYTPGQQAFLKINQQSQNTIQNRGKNRNRNRGRPQIKGRNVQFGNPGFLKKRKNKNDLIAKNTDDKTLWGVVVTDENSFLQIESKRLPPSLVSKVFLENEFFFKSGEFAMSNMYIDWFFENNDAWKGNPERKDQLLEVMLGVQGWRLGFLTGQKIEDIMQDNDSIDSEKKGGFEYLLGKRLKDMKPKFQIFFNRRFDAQPMMAFAAAPQMFMAKGGAEMAFDDAADGGFAEFADDVSAEEESFEDLALVEPKKQGVSIIDNESDETLSKALQEDTILFSALGINLPQNGLSFQLPETVSKFRITVFGISSDGVYGVHTSLLQIQRPFNASMIWPRFIRENDVINPVLTLENNTSDFKRISISEFNTSFDLNPNQTRRIPLKMTTETMPFSFTAEDTSPNGASIPINVDPLVIQGFEIRNSETIILKNEDGILLSNDITFEAPREIVGQTNQIIVQYVQPSGEQILLNGLEKLIREPHGCFEQTSATTFPMVLLLSYLNNLSEQTDKVLAMKLDIESKLKNGVKRLLGFETDTGGFEWFGSSPGHATLTAYGVWQFTEMNLVGDFVDVDVIDRSLNWLRGKFEQVEHIFEFGSGLDSFGRPPQNISDIYIIFVMSLFKDYSIDFEDLIEPVLAKYTNQILKNKDSYMLAFVGLIFSNQNQPQKVDEVASLLTANQDKNTGEFLTVKTSITRSSGKSLKVETTSLAVLFLLKAGDIRYSSAIKQAVEFLQTQIQDGSFGSTQATVLALKALTEYSKNANNNKQESMSFNVLVNGGSYPLTVDFENEDAANNLIIDIPDFDTNIEIEIKNIDPLEQEDEKHIFALTHVYNSAKLWNTPGSPLRLSASRNRAQNQDLYRVNIENTENKEQGMLIATLHLPSYSKLNLNNLEVMRKTGQIAYYEIHANGAKLVLYWRGIGANESISVDFTLLDDFVFVNSDSAALEAYLYYDKEGSFVHQMI